MFNYVELLLSGFLGAFFATIITIIYQHLFEQVRLRRDVLLEVSDWLDGFYNRLQAIHVHKDRVYSGAEPSLTQEEYRKFIEDIRVFLLSERIKTIVALTYGEGDRLQCINALQGESQIVAQLFWGSSPENWKETKEKVDGKFREKIDPIKGRILREFLFSARVNSVLLDSLSRIFPTFSKIFRCKK